MWRAVHRKKFAASVVAFLCEVHVLSSWVFSQRPKACMLGTGYFKMPRGANERIVCFFLLYCSPWSCEDRSACSGCTMSPAQRPLEKGTTSTQVCTKRKMNGCLKVHYRVFNRLCPLLTAVPVTS